MEAAADRASCGFMETRQCTGDTWTANGRASGRTSLVDRSRSALERSCATANIRMEKCFASFLPVSRRLQCVIGSLPDATISPSGAQTFLISRSRWSFTSLRMAPRKGSWSGARCSTALLLESNCATRRRSNSSIWARALRCRGRSPVRFAGQALCPLLSRLPRARRTGGKRGDRFCLSRFGADAPDVARSSGYADQESITFAKDERYRGALSARRTQDRRVKGYRRQTHRTGHALREARFASVDRRKCVLAIWRTFRKSLAELQFTFDPPQRSRRTVEVR